MRLATFISICAVSAFLVTPAAAQINVPGTQPTITAAIAAATPGMTITVDPGTYVENPVVDKHVLIIGSGNGSNPVVDTIIDGEVTITAGGASAIDPLLLQDLRVTGAGDGVQINFAAATLQFIKLFGVALVGNTSNGLYFQTTGVAEITSDVEILGCLIDGNAGVGILGSSSAWIDDVTVTNTDVTNNVAGIAFAGTSSAGDANVTDWTITGGSISNNAPSPGASGGFGGGVWLKTSGSGSNITGIHFVGVTIQDNTSSAIWNAAGVSIYARFAPSVVSGITFDGCTIGSTDGSQPAGINIDTDGSGTTGIVAIDNTLFSGLTIGIYGDPSKFTLTNVTFVNVTTPIFVFTGAAPRGVVLMDWEGDSDLDIATADSGSDTVTVLTNDGQGVFHDLPITITLTPGDEPFDLAYGDFTSPDSLAVACAGSDTLRIVDGGGILFTYALPAVRPVGLARADFDGAGGEDVAVACEGEAFTGGYGLVVVLDGVGASLIPGAAGPLHDVTVGDFNGDTFMDVAAAQSGDIFTPSDNRVLVWLGDGIGGFGAPTSHALGSAPLAIDAFDLSGDGNLDLAVTVGTPVGTNGLIVLDGDGAGNFTPSASTAGGQLPADVACADLDDDSVPGFIANYDAITVNQGSQNYSDYSDYQGAGAWGSVTPGETGPAPVAVAIGDLNDDDTPDVVIIGNAFSNILVLLAIPPALNQSYGTGCAGLTGIPVLVGNSLPEFGLSAYSLSVSNARPFSPVIMAISLGLDDFALGGGCSLYLEQPFVFYDLFTDAFGDATYAFSMPSAVDPYVGLNAYFQAAIYDDAAFNFFALTNAVRTKFGY